MAAIRVYNRCLSQQEISQLATEMTPGTGNAHSTRRSDNNFPEIMTLPGGTTIEMVKVQAGSFMMGSPEDERGRFGDEKQHRVTLTKDYWLGKYEVTQRQWQAVMGGSNPSWYKRGGNYPVENMTWDDAKKFCDRLNNLFAGKLPRGYRFDLPTEAQWEYACRAGTTTALNNGKDLTSIEGCCRNLDNVGWYKNRGMKTNVVGGKLPNAWGLYDMHGNVWEWCRDWYGPYGGDAIDPTGPARGSIRVRRGGSGQTVAGRCSSSYRHDFEPETQGASIGFRLALVFDDGQKTVQVGNNKKSSKMISLPGGTKIEMVRISAGTFMMGSPSGEFRRFSSRENMHRVTITKDYWMSRYEITQEQYVAIMGNNPSKFRGSRLPVEQVTWTNADTFCKRMNDLCKKDIPPGYQFDLPTEAEWEYACRAGTTTCLNNGQDIFSDQRSNAMDEIAWYSRNSNMTTHEVGLKRPNAWGLYDMQGNVSEWCCEWSEQYSGNQVDPITKNSRNKSLRSGAYFNDPRHIRQAFRHPVSGYQDLFSKSPTNSGNNGIRLVLVPRRK